MELEDLVYESDTFYEDEQEALQNLQRMSQVWIDFWNTFTVQTASSATCSCSNNLVTSSKSPCEKAERKKTSPQKIKRSNIATKNIS